MLKLHVVSNNFQVSNDRFSFENVARGDTYYSRKRKQEPLLNKAASLRVMSTRHQSDI